MIIKLPRGIAPLVALVVLQACVSVHAAPVLHKFQYWGTMKPVDKLNFFNGWTNGFLAATPSYGNKLTGTIEQPDVKNCRYDMNNTACQTIVY